MATACGGMWLRRKNRSCVSYLVMWFPPPVVRRRPGGRVALGRRIAEVLLSDPEGSAGGRAARVRWRDVRTEPGASPEPRRSDLRSDEGRTPMEMEKATDRDWASINARLRDSRKRAHGKHEVLRERVLR